MCVANLGAVGSYQLAKFSGSKLNFEVHRKGLILCTAQTYSMCMHLQYLRRVSAFKVYHIAMIAASSSTVCTRKLVSFFSESQSFKCYFISLYLIIIIIIVRLCFQILLVTRTRY